MRWERTEGCLRGYRRGDRGRIVEGKQKGSNFEVGGAEGEKEKIARGKA